MKTLKLFFDIIEKLSKKIFSFFRGYEKYNYIFLISKKIYTCNFLCFFLWHLENL